MGYVFVRPSHTAEVDDAAVPLVSQYNWRLSRDGYAVARIGGRLRSMHRYVASRIMGLRVNGWVVDHVSGDRLDNRSSNLRLLSNQQNLWRQISRTGKSPYKGVTLHPRNNRWCAYIKKDGRQHHLGYFDTAELAAQAYDAAARELFGEWARVNFPREGEA